MTTTRAVVTPSDIGAAFAAVGREVPSLDRCAQLADCLLIGGDLERLADPNYTGPAAFAPPYPLYRTARDYVDALAEASDAGRHAARLLAEAQERERWARNAEAEADYRERCAATWAERGDAETAKDYADRAASERRFGAHCREIAHRKRTQAADLQPEAA